MTYKRNLELAQEVLKEIKENVTSSHDIISAIEMPVLIPAQIKEYQKKFGEDRVKRTLDYLAYSSKIREKLWRKEFIRLENENAISPITTLYVAITMMGIGECADTSNLGTILLCLKECESPVNIVFLEGRKPGGDIFPHALIVIGNCEVIAPLTDGRKKPIETFKYLSNDCVFLDPLIGVVGRANQIQSSSLENNYFQTYALSHIRQIIEIEDPKAVKTTSQHIYDNAKVIYEKWSQQIAPYKKSTSSFGEAATAEPQRAMQIAKEALTSPIAEFGLFETDPHLKLLKQLKQLEVDTSTAVAFESIHKKNYTQAIRRICTSSSEVSINMLSKLLKFKGELSINLDEQQASGKKLTALHVAASYNNQTAYDLLIASGANPDIFNSEGKKAADCFSSVAADSNLHQ